VRHIHDHDHETMTRISGHFLLMVVVVIKSNTKAIIIAY